MAFLVWVAISSSGDAIVIGPPAPWTTCVFGRKCSTNTSPIPQEAIADRNPAARAKAPIRVPPRARAVDTCAGTPPAVPGDISP